MNMMDAITYVQEHNLYEEANHLANQVGDIYMACLMLYKNINPTKKNIAMCKRIVKDEKEKRKEWFELFVHSGRDIKNI